MTKRRVFDIDFPADAPPASEPPAPAADHRRGPMAAAIVGERRRARRTLGRRGRDPGRERPAGA
jgi:hypothetical protein